MPDELENVDLPVDPADPGNPDEAPDTPELPTLPEAEGQPEPTPVSQPAPAVEDGTDWKKRYGDSQRYINELRTNFDAQRADAERLQAQIRAQQAQMANYGIEPEMQNQPIDVAQYVTKSEVDALKAQAENQNRMLAWQLEKTNFVAKNPEYADQNMSEMLDMQAMQIANAEMRDFGQVRSSIDYIMDTAKKKVDSFVQSQRAIGKKAATEKRVKIKEQAVTEGDTRQKGSSDEPDYDPDAGYVQHHAMASREFLNRPRR